MNKKKLFSFISKKFQLRPSSNGWYRFKSVFDAKPGEPMAIHFDKNSVKCWRTGYRSNIKKFIQILTDKKDILDLIEGQRELDYFQSRVVQLKNTTKISLPSNMYFLDDEVVFQKRVIKYLKSRKLEDLDFLNSRSIGFCTEGEWFGRMIIPFMNPSLAYYVGRTFTSHPLKYKNPKTAEVGVGKTQVLYNEQALQSSYIDLVEGPLDALSCGDHGVATLGWSLSQHQLSKILNSPCKRINIIPDNGFYKKAMQIAFKLFQHKEVYIANIDGANGNDVNDIGRNNIQLNKVTWTLMRSVI